MQVLRLYALVGIRGICTACWIVVREELENIEQQWTMRSDKNNEPHDPMIRRSRNKTPAADGDETS